MSLVSIDVTINLVLLLSFLETTIKILFRLLICFMYQSIAMVKSEGGFYLTTHFSLGKLAYQYFVHILLLVNDKQPFLNQQKGSIDYEWFYVLFNLIRRNIIIYYLDFSIFGNQIYYLEISTVTMYMSICLNISI